MTMSSYVIYIWSGSMCIMVMYWAYSGISNLSAAVYF